MFFLCNSVGTLDPPHKPTDDTTAEEFKDLLNLNLISYFLASKVRSSINFMLIVSASFSKYANIYFPFSLLLNSMLYLTCAKRKATSSICPAWWPL